MNQTLPDTLTLEKFILEIPRLREVYLTGNPSVLMLEESIQLKVLLEGYLDKNDLGKIADWGGNAHSVKQKMSRYNSDQNVKECTRATIAVLGDPVKAFNEITNLNYWGPSFGSKTLAFLSPTCPILDQVVNEILGDSDNWINNYATMVRLCENLKPRIQGLCKYRPKGEWFARDVEMAIFQYGWDLEEHGKRNRNRRILGHLPI